jgi:hypothetical protein
MKLGIDFLDLSPKIINKGNKIPIEIIFEAKNKSDIQKVTFTLSILGTTLPFYFLNKENKRVKTLKFDQDVTKRWKKYTINVEMSLKSKPNKSEAVLIQLKGKNDTGEISKELTEVICS